MMRRSPHPVKRWQQAGAGPGWQPWGGEFICGAEKGIPWGLWASCGGGWPQDSATSWLIESASQRQQAPNPSSPREGLGLQLPCALYSLHPSWASPQPAMLLLGPCWQLLRSWKPGSKRD